MSESKDENQRQRPNTDNAVFDLAVILSQVTQQDANGGVSINASVLRSNTQTTINTQQALSEQGLYVSSNHRYYNDGQPGGITNFGLKMAVAPDTSSSYLNDTVMNDPFLTGKEVLKLQIALNANTDNPAEKITVDGDFGPQTAGRFISYLEDQKAALGEEKFEALIADKSCDLIEKLLQHGDKTKLAALGITSDGPCRTAFKQTTPSGGEGITLTRPISDYRISSEFGPRNGRPHDGIDIAAPMGTKLLAPADAEVAYSGHSDGYGQTIILYHGQGVYTLHAHLDHDSTAALQVGDTLRQGEAFAEVGDTGRIRGIHLHTEVIINGKTVDPLQAYGKDLSDPGTQQALISNGRTTMANLDNDSRIYSGRIANSYNPRDFDQYLASRDTGSTEQYASADLEPTTPVMG